MVFDIRGEEKKSLSPLENAAVYSIFFKKINI